MLKKYMKDSSGSALIAAIMVMLVVFILVASFVGNVTASTRIDTDSVKLDQAYLVAKSGMRFLEETIDKKNLTGTEVLNFYGTGKNTKINITEGTNQIGYCDVYAEAISGGDHQYNLVVTGYFDGTPYKLYKYKAIAEETTMPTTISGSDARKAAIMDYNYGGSTNTLNIGVVGPILYLGNTENVFKNGNGSSAGNVASRGDIKLATSNDNDGYQSIFSRGKVSFDHSMNIYGEVYCIDFDAAASGNHVHIYNTVYAKNSLTIGYANSDFMGLVSGGDMSIGGDGALVNGDVICGSNLYLGLAATKGANNGIAKIYGDIYCNGNVVINYMNAGDVFIDGDIYAKGSVIIKHNGTTVYSSQVASQNSKDDVVTGQIYSKMGETFNSARYGGTIYKGGTMTGANVLLGKFPENSSQSIKAEIQAKLDAEVPVQSTPVTSLPGDNEYTLKTYGSLDAITTTPYEKEGFMVYTITQSGTITFDLDTVLSTQVGGKYPAILVDTVSNASNAKKIDLYFTGNFKLDDIYGNGNCGKFMVNDHNHSGLVRFFLKDGIDVKLNCQTGYSGSNSNYWLVYPLDDTGNIDWDYVPNLYVFSLQSTNKSIGRFGSQNGRPCFPGYWLTPTLSTNTTTTSGFSGIDSTPVTRENCPRIHGMLAVQSAEFQPTGEVIVKFFDPDTAPGQKWSYDQVINGVYTAVADPTA